MKLIEWFRSLFKPEAKILVVELPTRSPFPYDEKIVETLPSHPGFLMILDKLRNEQAVLIAALRSTKHADIRAVDNLQNGIYWTGYLEDTINKITVKRQKPQSVVVESSIEADFKRILAQISGV